MKRRLFFVLFSSLLGSGCGIGGMWMNGDPSAGRNIIPIRDYWVKSEIISEVRNRDWVECGGLPGGQYGISVPERSTSRVMFEAAEEERKKIGMCMEAKRYEYKREGLSFYTK